MKDIKEYKGFYAITESGEVWAYPNPKKGRWKEGRFLKTWLIGNGYKTVMLYKNLIPKKFLVHRLVALTYIPNSKNLPEVNHVDGNRLNNNLENLEWISVRDNHSHAWRNGLYDKNIGQNHYRSKLSDKQIKEVRNLYKKGIKGKEIAERFNVSPSFIYRVVRNKLRVHKLS